MGKRISHANSIKNIFDKSKAAEIALHKQLNFFRFFIIVTVFSSSLIFTYLFFLVQNSFKRLNDLQLIIQKHELALIEKTLQKEETTVSSSEIFNSCSAYFWNETEWILGPCLEIFNLSSSYICSEPAKGPLLFLITLGLFYFGHGIIALGKPIICYSVAGKTPFVKSFIDYFFVAKEMSFYYDPISHEWFQVTYFTDGLLNREITFLRPLPTGIPHDYQWAQFDFHNTYSTAACDAMILAATQAEHDAFLALIAAMH